MKNRRLVRAGLALVGLVSLLVVTTRRPASAPVVSSLEQRPLAAVSTPGPLTWPLTFEHNDGQFDAALLYTARAPHYAVGLKRDGLSLRLAQSQPQPAALEIDFLGSDGAQQVTGLEPLATVSNYFVGDDPARWRTGVPHVGRVTLGRVYPHIDATFYGTDRQLEYDFVVQPGGDPSRIALDLSGADRLHVNTEGDLVMRVGLADFVQRRPIAYQPVEDGTRRPVDVEYRLRDEHVVEFVVAAYDQRQPLVIDPVLVYSTYLGGSSAEYPGGSFSFAAPAALDTSGNLIVTGSTASTDFPLAGTAPASSNIFVAKFNATGSALLFATYLGGSGTEDKSSIAIDATGALYVAANTTSGNLPVTSGAFDNSFGGVADAFVAKLTSVGALTYLTYLGGTQDDSVEAIAVNAAGNAFVTGSTQSTDFPIASAFQAVKSTDYDAFVTKLNPTGSGLVFSTYLGGGDIDSGYSIAVDTTSAVYVAGQTFSANFPTASPLQGTRSGAADVFVTKLASSGTSLTYSTYLGGTGASDENAKLAIDAAGNVYLAGFTTSADFPAGAGTPAQAVKSTGFDGFVAKLNTAGSALVYRTFLGGTGTDTILGIAVDRYTNVYVTGFTTSANFPTAGQAWDTVLGGPQDAFVTKVNATGSTFKYSSYLGGTAGAIDGSDSGIGVVVDTPGNAYVTGWTRSNNFPTAFPSGSSVFDSTIGGSADAFATKVSFEDDDNDGLPDDWEEDNGIDPNDGGGNNGCNGDPDNDGSTNCGEYGNNTPPTSAVVRYFAEGATSSFFDDQFALANPSGSQTATVVMRFRTSAGGTPVQHNLTIGPNTRASVDPKAVSPTLQNAEFSTEIRSNLTVLSDRTMRWGSGSYGSHAETSITAPNHTWYLAEGATISGFSLFYLIQNPNSSAANVQVRYLLPGGVPPVVRNYVVAANSRFNIWVNTIPGLEAAEVSGEVTTSPSTPIIVERAMYLNSQGQLFGAGHNSAGVTAPALNWFLAEGATGPYFDLFLLVANPSSTPATVQATYLLSTGQNIVRTYQVAANSRFNIWVDQEPGLSNAEVSTTVTSTNGVPIIVERAMWWPTNVSTWFEAHNSPGTTQTGTTWGLAEGEVGGTAENDTYVLIANTSAFAASVRVTLLFENGTTDARTYAIPASRRFNVWVRNDFAASIGSNRKFATLIESLGSSPAQIVVERAQYSNANGVTWAAGTNALATRLQ